MSAPSAPEPGPDPDRHHTPRRYRLRHRTRYTYDGDVTGCYERGLLRPRDTATQTVLAHQITVTPDPAVLAPHVDFYGNHSHYVEIRTPHRELDVVADSELMVCRPRVDLARLDTVTVADAVRAVAADAAVDPVERAEFSLPSPLVEVGPAVRAYAEHVLAGDRPLGAALRDLVHTVHRDFRYTKGVTSTRTTLPELLELRAGVCQDFAHLAVGCLRSLGLPARYVSGYLETSPPPGRPKLQGSDATHAWASVLVPGGTWVDLDPTNDQFADSRYLVTGWGRDFRDVSPLKGIVFTEAPTSQLTVEVDVDRLPDAPGEPR